MTRYTAFCKIIECGSFTRAAESMGYTQAAVSQMIRSLENEYSLTLLTRTRKGVKITREGSQLYPLIRQFISVHRDIQEKVDEINGLESGELRIGTFSSMSQRLLPGLMSDFSKKYPKINFVLSQGDNTTLPEWIKAGLVDLGFVYPEAASGLNCMPILKDEYLAVLPNEHRFTAKDSVSLEEMAGEPLIVVEEGGINTVVNAFDRAGLSPRIKFRLQDDYTILSMVEKGIGVSILPTMLLDRAPYKVKTLPITEPVCRTVGITFGDKDMLPTSARRFIEFIFGNLPNYLPSRYLFEGDRKE